MKKPLFAIISLLALVVAINAVFVLDQRQQALVIQLGEVVAVKSDPGLNFKIPFVQRVVFYDKRILEINIPPIEPNTRDRKRLIVDAYAKYRIIEPLVFFQKVQTEGRLGLRISEALEKIIRAEVAKVTLVDLLNTERLKVMNNIQQRADVEGQELGVEIVDVRIIRADLPQKNSAAIYERMKSSHEKEARETRAKGAEAAQRVKAEADKDRRITLAEAKKNSQITRGEGEGEATQIFAESFGKDADFFSFYRSMQAYRETLKKDDTTMVLSPNSEFLRYFNDNSGKRP